MSSIRLIAERSPDGLWSACFEEEPTDCRIGPSALEAVSRLLVDHPKFNNSKLQIDKSQSSEDRVIYVFQHP